MASNDNWIFETVADFIHSRIWRAPVQTFIDDHCLSFDYEQEDEDEEESKGTSQQKKENAQGLHDEHVEIHRQYKKLIDDLINGLGHDLNLDQEELQKACELPSQNHPSAFIDESFEQLYSAQDFSLFEEMMRRKNLILQLQALIALQIQWGILKPSETGEDLVLTLLLNATAPSTGLTKRFGQDQFEQEHSSAKILPIQSNKNEKKPIAVVEHNDDDDVEVVETHPVAKPKRRVEPEKPKKEVRQLADLRRRPEIDANWHRKLHADSDKDQAEKESENVRPSQTLNGLSQDVLRDKLRELTNRTSQVDPDAAAALDSRSEFLRQQRDLILKKKLTERKQDIEEEARNARPQSAAHAAGRAMANMSKSNSTESQQKTTENPEDLAKRQALISRIRRQVVDRQ